MASPIVSRVPSRFCLAMHLAMDKPKTVPHQRAAIKQKDAHVIFRAEYVICYRIELSYPTLKYQYQSRAVPNVFPVCVQWFFQFLLNDLINHTESMLFF